MKLIVDKKPKKKISYHLFNFFRDLLIIFSYVIGFCLYALIYLIWTIDFNNLSVIWIIIPILGLILGIAHMFFIYYGSLSCKALIMFSIMFYVFILPIVIAVVN